MADRRLSLLDEPHAHYSWTNKHGGPLVDSSDPALRFARSPPSAPMGEAPLPILQDTVLPPFDFIKSVNHFLAAGNDIGVIKVSAVQQAACMYGAQRCSFLCECR